MLQSGLMSTVATCCYCWSVAAGLLHAMGPMLVAVVLLHVSWCGRMLQHDALILAECPNYFRCFFDYQHITVAESTKFSVLAHATSNLCHQLICLQVAMV